MLKRLTKNKLLNNLYNDICSLRLQLLIMAFAFNVFVILIGQPQSVVITAIGLLATAYTFWFSAKNNQVKMENELNKMKLVNNNASDEHFGLD